MRACLRTGVGRRRQRSRLPLMQRSMSVSGVLPLDCNRCRSFQRTKRFVGGAPADLEKGTFDIQQNVAQMANFATSSGLNHTNIVKLSCSRAVAELRMGRTRHTTAS